MAFAVFAFLAMFFLIGSAGLLLFYREVMLKRISEAINPRREQKRLTDGHQADRVLDRQRGGALREPDAEERQGSVGHQAAAGSRGISQRVRGEDFLRLQGCAFLCAVMPGWCWYRDWPSGAFFYVSWRAGRRLSGARLLAGQEDREAAKADHARVCRTCSICW